jgi:hypothetical protein
MQVTPVGRTAGGVEAGCTPLGAPAPPAVASRWKLPSIFGRDQPFALPSSEVIPITAGRVSGTRAQHLKAQVLFLARVY